MVNGVNVIVVVLGTLSANAKVNVVVVVVLGTLEPNVMSFRGTPLLSVINQIVSRECLTDDVKLINVFDAFPKRIVSGTKFRSHVTDDVMID